MLVLGKSIGIIGGADGPTAIFIFSSSPSISDWILLAVVVLALLGGTLWLCRRKGRKR